MITGNKITKVRDTSSIVVEQKENKPTLFSLIDKLTIKKCKWNSLILEEQKLFNPFMINRFLSMDLDLLEAINIIQRYNMKIDKQDCWALLCQLLPSKKLYLKYIKSNKEITDKELYYLAKEYP